MKVVIRTFLIGIALASAAMADLSSSTPDQATQVKLNALSQRVEAGDYTALSEASKLPPAISIPFISQWAGWGPGRRPPTDQAARSALRQVDGYATYLSDDLAKQTASGNVAAYDFEILEEIATPEAAAIAARYLFDFKTMTPPSGDVSGDSNLAEALLTLERMKLPDSPPPKTLNVSYADYLVQWQKWVVSKGIVPSDWATRIGAPRWLIALDTDISVNTHTLPSIPATSPTSSPSPRTFPAASSPATSSSPIAPESKGELDVHSHPVTRIVLPGTILILALSAWGVLAIIRRR